MPAPENVVAAAKRTEAVTPWSLRCCLGVVLRGVADWVLISPSAHCCCRYQEKTAEQEAAERRRQVSRLWPSLPLLSAEASSSSERRHLCAVLP